MRRALFFSGNSSSSVRTLHGPLRAIERALASLPTSSKRPLLMLFRFEQKSHCQSLRERGGRSRQKGRASMDRLGRRRRWRWQRQRGVIRRWRKVKQTVEIAIWVGRRSSGVGEVGATGTRAAEAEMAEVRPSKVRRRGWRGLGMEAHRGAVTVQGAYRVAFALCGVDRSSYFFSHTHSLVYRRQIGQK